MAENIDYNKPGPTPESLHDEPDGLAPPDFYDPVIEAYKRDVDRTLLRENLKLTVQERLAKLEDVANFAEELRKAGQRLRASGK